MATIQIRVDDNTKAAADSLFTSLGLDTSTAVRMFIVASLAERGIPFEIKQNRKAFEINDGFGSYVCEYGHLHDYSKLNAETVEAMEDVRQRRNLHGPYDTIDGAMKAMLED